MERNAHHAWQAPLLAALEVVPFISRAARKVGIHRTRVHEVMREDADFAARVREAQGVAYDRAEREAWRRAVSGVEKGVWHNGMRVGTELVYSDALLKTILAAKRREEYGDKVEMTGANGAPLLGETDDTAKAARLAALLTLAEARRAIDKATDGLV
ncbi:MAG: terminase [Caldilineaceae bacterium]